MNKSELSKKQKQEIEEEKLGIILKQQATFSGPIPPPQILEGYKNVDSSLPDRIVTMAEKDLKTRHRMNYLGWFGTYSLSLILIGGGVYLIANDKAIFGLIILASSAIYPILQLFFKKQDKKD